MSSSGAVLRDPVRAAVAHPAHRETAAPDETDDDGRARRVFPDHRVDGLRAHRDVRRADGLRDGARRPPRTPRRRCCAKCASASHAVFAAMADACSACDDDETPSHTTSTVHGSPVVVPVALASASSLCGRRRPGIAHAGDARGRRRSAARARARRPSSSRAHVVDACCPASPGMASCGSSRRNARGGPSSAGVGTNVGPTASMTARASSRSPGPSLRGTRRRETRQPTRRGARARRRAAAPTRSPGFSTMCAASTSARTSAVAVASVRRGPTSPSGRASAGGHRQRQERAVRVVDAALDDAREGPAAADALERVRLALDDARLAERRRASSRRPAADDVLVAPGRRRRRRPPASGEPDRHERRRRPARQRAPCRTTSRTRRPRRRPRCRAGTGGARRARGAATSDERRAVGLAEAVVRGRGWRRRWGSVSRPRIVDETGAASPRDSDPRDRSDAVRLVDPAQPLASVGGHARAGAELLLGGAAQIFARSGRRGSSRRRGGRPRRAAPRPTRSSARSWCTSMPSSCPAIASIASDAATRSATFGGAFPLSWRSRRASAICACT